MCSPKKGELSAAPPSSLAVMKGYIYKRNGNKYRSGKDDDISTASSGSRKIVVGKHVCYGNDTDFVIGDAEGCKLTHSGGTVVTGVCFIAAEDEPMLRVIRHVSRRSFEFLQIIELVSSENNTIDDIGSDGQLSVLIRRTCGDLSVLGVVQTENGTFKRLAR